MGPCVRRDDVVEILASPSSHIVFAAQDSQYCRNQEQASGSDMSDIKETANLADMVRARAKSRGDALVYEFEGRQTSFAEFDVLTNRVANALKALGVKPRAHHLG